MPLCVGQPSLKHTAVPFAKCQGKPKVYRAIGRGAVCIECCRTVDGRGGPVGNQFEVYGNAQNKVRPITLFLG